MKYLVAGGIALLVVASVNTARAQPPAYSWTGCYAGVNGGYGWNNGSLSYRDPNTDADPINHQPDMAGATVAYIPTPTSVGGSGGLAGVEGGCNLQSRQWVVGVEADFDWGHIAGSSTTSGNSGALINYKESTATGLYTSVDDTGTANEQVSIGWLSTVRARGGFAIEQNLLLYGTGGLAVGGVKTQGAVTTSSPFGFFNPGWSGASSAVRVGGVIGGGLEWAIYDRWTLKGEYLWYDLGNASHQLNCTPATCAIADDATLGSVSTSISGSVVRVGLNYKLY